MTEKLQKILKDLNFTQEKYNKESYMYSLKDILLFYVPDEDKKYILKKFVYSDKYKIGHAFVIYETNDEDLIINFINENFDNE